MDIRLVTDRERIDTGLAQDWHQIGNGLTMDWHQIGDGLVGIGSHSALDWHWIGDGLATDWHSIGVGLAMNLRWIGAWLVLDWHPIGQGSADNGMVPLVPQAKLTRLKFTGQAFAPICANPLPIFYKSVPIHRQPFTNPCQFIAHLLPIDCQSYTNRLPIRCQFSANPVPIQSNQSKAAHLAPLEDQSIDNPLCQSITNTRIQCQSASPGPIHQSGNPLTINQSWLNPPSHERTL